MLCVFSIPRVFYRCPTTSVAPRSKNTCRPGRKFFHFQNHYRPSVDHATVCATPDCVHRVTVLCAVLWTLSHISDHDGVFGLCCATLLVLCDCVLLCCALCLLCCVGLVLHCRRRRLVKVTHGRPRARSGAPYQCLPLPETKPKTMWSCMWRALPNLTGSCAHGAKPIGVFGLVTVPLPFPTNGPFWLCAIIRQYYQSLPAAVLNTHTMISTILLYSLIVAGLAWASYLLHQIRRK